MVAALPAVLALALFQSPDECRHEAERSARVDASGAAQLDLIARAGSLEVIGREGLGEVRVRGRACASSADLLEKLQVQATRAGDRVNVEVAEIDHDSWRDNQYARLDLVVEVPAGIASTIEDGSGPATVRGLGRTTIVDGSGELTVESIAGPVRITDGSGELTIRGIRGDVDIEDGSGEVTVSDVTGSVTIRDGSGEIDAREVTGSLRILEDGSGQVAAHRIGGDFEVARGRFERIRHSEVRGELRLPAPRRRGR